MGETAFIYSVNNSRVGAHLGFARSPHAVVRPLASKLGVEVSGADTLTATLLSGKEKGEEVGTIGPNQRASILIGTLNPGKYQAKVSINPALYASATVQCVEIVEPGEGAQVILYVTAHQKLELTDLKWLVRLYSYS